MNGGYRCHRFDDRLGDRGQRYEVRAENANNGDEEVIGWADDPAQLIAATEKWPRYCRVWAVDRDPEPPTMSELDAMERAVERRR